MIRTVSFTNFRSLRDATLPLSPFTLIVGANGSGKSTALYGISAASGHGIDVSKIATVGTPINEKSTIQIAISWAPPHNAVRTVTIWRPNYGPNVQWSGASSEEVQILNLKLSRIRLFSLNAPTLANNVILRPHAELSPDGSNLAGVLDRLRDEQPENFEALNKELGDWIPEFDRVLFETPSDGNRSIQLRTRKGGYRIDARDLSQGTLLALAFLTIAYMPNSPGIICLEEPDRGIHPRLFREVRDALYRLSYPEITHNDRQAVQVIATTHSPYFLDLFRDRPEEVVIAQKNGLNSSFKRLSDQPELQDILRDGQLGEVWYTGILGGVPQDK